jgi:hypothetical protein
VRCKNAKNNRIIKEVNMSQTQIETQEVTSPEQVVNALVVISKQGDPLHGKIGRVTAPMGKAGVLVWIEKEPKPFPFKLSEVLKIV